MKLTALQYGVTELTQAMIFPDGAWDKKDPISLLFFLLEDGGRKLLFDVGCDTMGGFDLFQFETPDQTLKKYGVDPSEITDVFISHAHHDHIDGLHYYPQANIYIHEAELPEAEKYLPANARLHTFQDEFRYSEDVVFRHIGGHSAGSSVALITRPDSTWVLCGDECYSHENLKKQIPTGSSTCPQNSLHFVQEYGKPGYTPVIYHDPDLIGMLGTKVLF